MKRRSELRGGALRERLPRDGPVSSSSVDEVARLRAPEDGCREMPRASSACGPGDAARDRIHGDTGDDVHAAALSLAREIASNSPMAVRGTKAVLGANEGRTVDEGLDFVARWNTMYLQTNDLREAITAVIERRPPVFGGD